MGWSAGSLLAQVVPAVIMNGFIHIDAAGLQSGPGFFGILAFCCDGAGAAQVAGLGT